MPDPQQPDPVADALKPVQMSDQSKALLWDAYHQASSADDLTERLKKLPGPDAVKAQLWDLKSADHPAQQGSGDAFLNELNQVTSAAAQAKQEAAKPYTIGQAMYDASPLPLFEPKNLPITAGAVAGALTGGASLPVTAAVTGLGAAAGEGARQAIQGEPASPGKMMIQGGAQGLAELATGGLSALAGPLKQGAKETMISALGPAGRGVGPVGKEALATAKAAAPRLLEEGFRPSSHVEGLQQIGMTIDGLTQKVTDIVKALPEGAAMDSKQVIDFLEKSKGGVMGSNGVRVAVGTDKIKNAVLDEVIGDLKQIGDKVPPREVQKLLQKYGPLAKWSKMNPTPENVKVEGYQTVYNGIREGLNQVSSDIGPINKDISFWLGLKKIMQQSADRPQSAGSGMTGAALAAGTELGAAAVHAIQGGGLPGMSTTAGLAGGAVGAGILGRYVQRAMRTPGWRFASAQVKDALADAIAREDVGAVARVTAQIAAGKGAQALSATATTPTAPAAGQ